MLSPEADLKDVEKVVKNRYRLIHQGFSKYSNIYNDAILCLLVDGDYLTTVSI